MENITEEQIIEYLDREDAKYTYPRIMLWIDKSGELSNILIDKILEYM